MTPIRLWCTCRLRDLSRLFSSSARAQ